MNTGDYILTEDKSVKNSKMILVLPNGYGPLKYISSLSEKMSKSFGKIVVPVLPGQGGATGILNIESAKKSLERIAQKVIKGEKQKISILCHCSSLLYLSEIEESNFWNKINKIVVYSFLANPQNHKNRFIKKANGFGVRIESKDYDELNRYSDLNYYKKIPVPIHIVHPRTAMNRIRASRNDLLQMSKLPNVVEVIEPDFGYDIENSCQLKEVESIVDNYFKDLL